MALVLVPTPLGNLGDITLRSIETLRSADLIVAEDTRVARKLLNALGIGPKELWSYREQNAQGATPGILERARHEIVALVTDAGMPGISDPGVELVAHARDAGIAVEALPGPSAAIGAAVLSGFPLRRFVFEGFPPRASGARKTAFREALESGITSIWYESPQRIIDAMHDLEAIAPHAHVFLLREYTKKFEQQARGTPREIVTALETPVRGEVAFVIAPGEPREAEAPVDADAAIDRLLDEGRSVRDIAKLVSEQTGDDRRSLYARASSRKQARGMGRGRGAEEQSSE